MPAACAHCGRMIHRKVSRASSRSFCSLRCYGQHRRTGQTVPCDWCGTPTYKPPSRLTEQNFCSAGCRNRWLSKTNIEVRNVPGHSAGHKAPHLTALNRQRNPLGSIDQSIRPVSSKLYRQVAARMLGRQLQSGEVVHHINGDRSDNRPDNLAVLPRAEHHRLHMNLACGRMETLTKGGDAQCQKKPHSPEA